MAPKTSILYQNTDKTVVLLDIPRSLELAQGIHFAKENQILSSSIIQNPWTNIPEPRSAKALANLEPESIEELLLRRHLELALQQVRGAEKAGWCLSRFSGDLGELGHAPDLHARPDGNVMVNLESAERPQESSNISFVTNDMECFGNDTDLTMLIHRDEFSTDIYMPPRSTYLIGSLIPTNNLFKSFYQKFNFVLLDPPWPNRSAKRHGSYAVASEVAELLSHIHLADNLEDDALVGVWITNRPAFRSFILDPGGFFDQAGVQLEEEWVWLKITNNGDPIFGLGSRWRKPYETLLLGRRQAGPGVRLEGVSSDIGGRVKRRVIMAVPDIHSRKPNIKELVEPMLPSEYTALEVFARNLTAGWWSWGDEVGKFQGLGHWVKRHDDGDETVATVIK